MKKCPYCAEEIQDEAIKCRYCFSDLTATPPTAGTESTMQAEPAAGPATPGPDPSAASSPSSPPPDASAGADGSSVRYTHSGYRYVLGYGADFFGIWDRQSPTSPAERHPRTDDGWRDAWTRFVTLEPNHVPVPVEGAPTTTGTEPSVDDGVLQYTHSGQRYLLGYGRTFFGIWDRQAPHAPVDRFDRDDSGWEAAWRRFNQLETHYTEVGLGGGSSAGSAPASGT